MHTTNKTKLLFLAVEDLRQLLAKFNSQVTIKVETHPSGWFSIYATNRPADAPSFLPLNLETKSKDQEVSK